MLVDGNYTPISCFPTRSGDATIRRDGKGITINAGKGDDNINVCALGGGLYGVNVNGKMHVFNRAEMESLTINGGKGNDKITVGPGVDIPVKVNGGKGNDTIINYANGTQIDGGKGDDTILNRGHGARINGGKGRDTIDSTGNFNQIGGGKGDDQINSVGFGNTIDGGKGSDTINSLGGHNTIRGGKGNDRISSFGNDNFVQGNRGNDDILSYGHRNQVDGGRGCDNVRNVQPPCVSPFGWNGLGRLDFGSLLNNASFGAGYLAGLRDGLSLGRGWNEPTMLGGGSWSFNLSASINFSMVRI